MKLIITVDTEADSQHKRETDINLENIKYLPRFQSLCEKYGYKPTYLVTYEVADDMNAVKLLKSWQDADKAEIGAHLHPWTNPPFIKDREWEAKAHRYPHELDDKELKDKLTSLTAVIEGNFGKRPTSFRAGRWGSDGRVIKALGELGYIADCSVTPKVSWQKVKGDPSKSGGPDYRLAPVKPYEASTKNIWEPGSSGILEVPMTIVFTGILKKENTLISQKFLSISDGITKKAVNRIFFRQKWLRIFANSNLKHFKGIYNSAIRNRLPVIEFMIHSNELKSGGSVYSKTETSVEIIYQRLDEMLKYFKHKNLQSATLSGYTKEYKR